jgi:hypothetical protein
VSRRWDLLRPVIGTVLASFVPDPVQVLGRRGTALVDGTVCPAWDWDAIPDLFSGKAGYAGMNVQIAATLNGDVAAIGPVPVHGEEGGRYRCPIGKYESMLTAVTGLFFFAQCCNV